jgi:hypothetical protein
VCLFTGLVVAPYARATETESLGIRVLPAQGAVKIDGQTDDWDLTGSIFICSDVENQRAQFSTWVSLMYDADNLYLLSRWNDETPLNNPGSVNGDAGFAGDALQFRTITHAGQSENERTGHFTC